MTKRPAAERRRSATYMMRFRAGDHRSRMQMAFALVLVIMLLVVARVVYLQSFGADDLLAAGRAQRVTESVLRAQRGTIFDRDGTEMALSVPSTTVYANPTLVTDPTGTAAVLASMLSLPPTKQQSLLEAFVRKEKQFVYVARQVEDSVADAVLALNLPGIDTIREPRRILPSGSVGLSIIGHTNIDGKGTGGLEMQFQDRLAGIDGERVREHDRRGRSIPGSGTTTIEPVPGDDLVLTIDRTLQFQVEQALVARVASLEAKGGTVVVMDTATGDIYAVANVARDPETLDVEVTSANLAAVEAFEPGSVAKVFSMSGVVDSGVADPTTEIDVPGSITFDPDTPWEKTISDAEPHDLMKMSMRDILVHSSNLGTYFLTDRLGSTRLEEYLRLFGFGEKTALDFPGETAGKVFPASEWQGSEKATVTYGYHYQTSAFQLAAAVNTVANGGTYVAPRLVRGYVGSDGTVTEVAPSPSHPVISAAAAATVTEMLTGVVCEGTGREAQLRNISVAGKTGTAYKAQNGGYGDATSRRYRASFVGYFPAQAPRITILVSIDEPDPTSNDRFGGKAAAPLFAKIATLALHELRIAPQPGDAGCPAA